MIESRNGWIIVSELVTDGYAVWLMTERYMDYSRQEAEQLFASSIHEQGLRIANADSIYN